MVRTCSQDPLVEQPAIGLFSMLKVETIADSHIQFRGGVRAREN
jgi:hypothetical protein